MEIMNNQSSINVKITAMTHRGNIRESNEGAIAVDRWIRSASMGKPQQIIYESSLSNNYLESVQLLFDKSMTQGGKDSISIILIHIENSVNHVLGAIS